MYDTMFLIGLICAAVAGLFLILTVVMFFALNVPAARKLARRRIDPKEVEDLRRERAMLPIPEREVLAPPVAPATTAAPAASAVVVKTAAKKISEDFIIEKSMIFVSTDEIM